VQRARFNDLATKGHISDWRTAFEHGDAKATGIEQVIKLIVKRRPRSRKRRARLRRSRH